VGVKQDEKPYHHRDPENTKTDREIAGNEEAG
jgi:hypothetical protein